MKFLQEIELLAEDHPFVQGHLVRLLGKILEHSTGVVALFAEPLECIFKVLVMEETASWYLSFLILLKHEWAF